MTEDPVLTGSPTVIVFPGFTRTSADLTGFISFLLDRGFDATAVTLAPRVFPILYCSKRHLNKIAGQIAQDDCGRRLVLIGHSAGASAASYLAYLLRQRGVNIAGVIFADGVDSPNHLIAQSLPQLHAIKIGAVLAPPSPCNRRGALEKLLQKFPAVELQVVAGAGHGDIEGAGKWIYRRACGDVTDVHGAARFRTALINVLGSMT